MVEAQPRPLPAGHQNGTQLSGGQGFFGPSACLFRAKRIAGRVEPERRRRFRPRGQLGHVPLPVSPVEQSPHQGKIDRLDLPCQRFSLRPVESVPEGEQMLLAERLKRRKESVFGHSRRLWKAGLPEELCCWITAEQTAFHFMVF